MTEYPPWHPVELAAKALFEKAATGKPWTGRRTNRAYYRRRARADLVRSEATITGDSPASGNSTNPTPKPSQGKTQNPSDTAPGDGRG